MHFKPEPGSLPQDHPGSGVAPWLPLGQLHRISSTSPCVRGGGLVGWLVGWLNNTAMAAGSGPPRGDLARFYFLPLTTLLTAGTRGGAPLAPSATFWVPILGPTPLPHPGTILAPLSLPAGKQGDHLVPGYRPGPSSPSPCGSQDPKSCPRLQQRLAHGTLLAHRGSTATSPRLLVPGIEPKSTPLTTWALTTWLRSPSRQLCHAGPGSGVGSRSTWAPAPPLASRPSSSLGLQGNA